MMILGSFTDEELGLGCSLTRGTELRRWQGQNLCVVLAPPPAFIPPCTQCISDTAGCQPLQVMGNRPPPRPRLTELTGQDGGGHRKRNLPCAD